MSGHNEFGEGQVESIECSQDIYQKIWLAALKQLINPTPSTY
jgi:hypothetical protein